jgi:hypothetical protein
MDFKEVGQFFTEKINKRELNLQSLSPTGFEFLQTYFLSANESANKIEKVKPKSNYTSNNYYSGMSRSGYTGYGSDYKMSYTNYGWGNQWNSNTTSANEKEKILVKVQPPELDEMDLLWSLVLESGHPDVIQKAVTFFISLHTNLDDELLSQKTMILNNLIKEIMSKLKTIKEANV